MQYNVTWMLDVTESKCVGRLLFVVCIIKNQQNIKKVARALINNIAKQIEDRYVLCVLGKP